MMEYKNTLEAALAKGRAIFVAGTGVSMAASVDPRTKRPHPHASWTGLLQDGIEWLRLNSPSDSESAEAHRTLIKMENPLPAALIAAADQIMRGMGGANSTTFANWLSETVGKIQVHDRSIIDALAYIEPVHKLAFLKFVKNRYKCIVTILPWMRGTLICRGVLSTSISF